MTFEQYWAILTKQWRIIVVCFVVVGVGAYIGSKLMTPLYQSTTLVRIAIRSGNNQADYNSLLASDQLVQTEAKLATSNLVLREVASHYPGLTVQQLAQEATSVPEPNTQLFEIDVLDASPTRAANLANDVAAVLIKQQAQETQQDNSQAQQQIQQDLQQTQQQIDAITSQIKALQSKPGNEAKVGILEIRLNALQQHYGQWQILLAQLELTEAENGNILRIAQPAQPSLAPARPSVLLNTGLGLLAGLSLGFVLALLFEQLDTRVRTSEALTQLLEWPVLATIWRLKSSEKEGELVNPPGHGVNVESYRILRTNIGFAGLDKPLRSLLVTSATPQEGKSTVAINLAIFMAKAGKDTLLIDADLRRPTLDEKFHLSADRMGLSNAVMACSHLHFAQPDISSPPTQRSNTAFPASFSLDPYVYFVDIPNLRVMPSGLLPPNPPELLDSKAMERFLKVIADCGAEVVILDAPPLLGLSDTSILAPKVDGTLVVVDITRSNKKNLTQLKTRLTQAGIHVLGCVVNKQRHRGKDTAYSYYYRTEEVNHSMQDGNVPTVPIAVVHPRLPDEQ